MAFLEERIYSLQEFLSLVVCRKGLEHFFVSYS